MSKNITAFLLAVLILVSGSGVVFSQHRCSYDGATEVTLFERTKGCCSTGSAIPCNNNEGLKSNCCQLKITYNKVQIVSSPAQNHVLVDGDFPVTSLLSFSFFKHPFESFSPISSDPPISENPLYSTFCQYLI